jgi:hypothetical protein
MSLRAYNTKNERVATGRSLGRKKGFAQFYPEKKAYASEEAWKSAWSKVDTAMTFSYLDPVDYLGDKMAEGMALGKNVAIPSWVKTPEVSTVGWDFKPVYKTVVPAGRYYVGDLCYALPENLYDGVFGGTRYQSGLYTQTGTNNFFFLGGTGGDGQFRGTDGYKYLVDAGILGIVPAHLCDLNNKAIRGGKFHTFDSPVTCVADGCSLRLESGWNNILIPREETEDEW